MKFSVLAEQELIFVFFSLASLLLAAFVMGNIFERLKAPKVVGEIFGGMLLGSSFLHYFFPEVIESIFKAFPEEDKVLNIFYQLGLVFLMFVSGLKTQIDIGKKNTKVIFILFVGATIFPGVMGFFFQDFFVGAFLGEAQNFEAFLIVFLLSIAVTSIPVISKIFFDLNLMNTKFSNMVLTTATIQDLFLWIFLNLAISMVSSKGQGINQMVITIAVTLLLFVVAKQASRCDTIRLPIQPVSFITLTFASLFFIITLLCSLHINLMYSAFIMGYVVKYLANSDERFQSKLQSLADFSFAFFIPVYFALVGIQLDVIHEFSWLNFIKYFIIAFGLEFFGCYLALQLTNLSQKSILNFSIVMNARGGPGIVLATVAYYYQIINIEFFTILILTTMLSSMLAGYWLRYQKNKDVSVFHHLELRRR